MNIAICDDDLIFLNHLESSFVALLSSLDSKYQVYSYGSGEEILNAAKQISFDIVFLDIDMPGLNGKDTAQRLRELSTNRFKLVFISDYYEEVFYTFKYCIESFIPKNKVDEFLDSEVKRIVDMIIDQNKENQTFSFKYSKNNGFLDGCVNLDEIVFIESLNGDVILHTVFEEYSLVNYKFEKIKKQFSKYNFVDIHRTCFINIAFISSIEHDDVVLKNGMRLPLSRRKRSNVKDAFFKYVKEKVVK